MCESIYLIASQPVGQSWDCKAFVHKIVSRKIQGLHHCPHIPSKLRRRGQQHSHRRFIPVTYKACEQQKKNKKTNPQRRSTALPCHFLKLRVMSQETSKFSGFLIEPRSNQCLGLFVHIIIINTAEK